MKINIDLLPMKLHYFFVFAGTAPFLPYLPVYANQNLNLSYPAIGLIYTILPFVGLLAKTGSGATSDWLNAHRKIFLTAIVVCGLGFFSIYFVPPMPTEPNSAVANIILDCSTPTSYLRYKFQKGKCGTSSSTSKIMKNITTTCQLTCDINEKKLKDICKFWEIPVEKCIEEVGLEVNTFSYLGHLLEENSELFIPVANLTYMNMEVRLPTCKNLTHLNCTTKCDDDELMEFFGAPNTILYNSYSDILSKSAFWAYLVCIAIGWSGLAILVVMSDTICFQLLGSEPNKYGRQRMFGSMGWGTFVIVTGFLIDFASSSDSSLMNYTPAFIVSGALLCFDLLVASRLKVSRENKGQMQVSTILKLFCDWRIFVFLLCCIMVGISTGVLWTYQLLLVEKIAFNWDCQFEHLKLLQGLIVGISCFGGEIPFFFLSGKIIKYLGHVHAMTLVIAVFGLRFILYYTVVNPWLFLPIELLNGFTFGIFYAVMTSYAHIIAPVGSQATIQGVVGAAFEGLGIACGGFIGGSLFSHVGESQTFLRMGIANLCFAFCHLLWQLLLNKFRPVRTYGESPRHEGYLPPSESLHDDVHNEDEPLDANRKV